MLKQNRRSLFSGAIALASLPAFNLINRGNAPSAAIRPIAPTPQFAATPAGTPFGGTPAAAGTPVASTPVAPTPIPDPLVVVTDQQPEYASTPSRGGSLRLLRPPADQSNFNPTAFRQDYQVFASYLDPLVRADPLTMEPIPWLATSWRISDDGGAIRIELRNDVRWHDGTSFTARDVVFSLLAYRDDADSGVRNLMATTGAVRDEGDWTVLVDLTAPDPAWLFNVGTLLMFQRDQYVETWETEAPGERSLSPRFDTGAKPVGTGPWKVSEVNGDGVGFRRNADYWQAPAWCDTLALTWESDPRSRVEAWAAGQVDLTWPIRIEDMPVARNTPGRLQVADAASIMFMAFNFDNPTGLPRFFDDLQLREALDLAIDRDALNERVFGGFSDMTATGTVAQPWARDSAIPGRQFDRVAARNLLATLGWADRDADGVLESLAGVPFDLTVVVRSDARRELVRAIRGVKADWAEIGVSLRIQLLPEPAFQIRVTEEHDYDLVAYAYDLYPGFTDFDLYGSAWNVRTNPQGWNPGGYADPEADQAIADYFAARTLGAQRDALRDLQRAVNANLFGIWLGFPAELLLIAADIDGFVPNKVWQTLDTRLLWRNVGSLE